MNPNSREIPWPGNQINPINEFRHDCYYKCHLENPTDSGWYEKTNECGQNCKRALQQFEYSQGKNPCELKLQAPVFWYESYRPPALLQTNTRAFSTTSMIDKFYITLFLIMIVLISFYLVLYIMYPT